MKVTINSKEYGLSWGLGALEIYCEAMDEVTGDSLTIDEAVDLITMPGKFQQKALVNLALAALQNYCEINDLSFDLTYRKLQAWISDLPQTEWDAVIKDFINSRYLGRTIAECYGWELPTEEVTPKKKVKTKSVNLSL
jgi:hypothetical protein